MEEITDTGTNSTDNDNIDNSFSNILSRRELLGNIWNAATDRSYIPGLVASAIPEVKALLPAPAEEISPTQSFFERYPAQPTELIFHENSFFEFENAEHPIDLSGMGWCPDGRIPFVTLEDRQSKLMWVSGIMGGIEGSFPYVWNPTTGLQPYLTNGGIMPSVMKEPNDRSQFYRNGYCGLTSVAPFNNQLIGFTHNEEWGSPSNGGGFRASVGLVSSNDGGRSFTYGPCQILGRKTELPGNEVTGAGQPCAIKVQDRKTKKEYMYIYYVEWLPLENKIQTGGADQIFLAKLALNNNSIGDLELYTKTGFKNILDEPFPDLQPVITPPHSVFNSNYAALPGISWNEKRQKLLAVFETNVGVCAAESADGIHWGQAELVAEYSVPLSNVWQNPNTESHSYPSLMDFSKENDNFTGEDLALVLAKGIGQGRSHSMVAIKAKTKV